MEASDRLELELKFYPADLTNDEEVLAIVRPLLEPEWRLVMWPPAPVLDVYFDGADLPLCRDDSTFRLRKRPRKDEWAANFKPPSSAETEYMERREVRTYVSVEEALEFKRGVIPGLAYRMATERLARVAADARPMPKPTIAPVLVVISHRRLYAIRPRNPVELRGRWHDQLAPSLAYVVIEDVTAKDIRAIDAVPLVRLNYLDATAPLPTTRFMTVEVEAGAEPGVDAAQATDLMCRIGVEIKKAMGWPPSKESKYRRSLRLLGLTVGAPPAAADAATAAAGG